MDKMEELMLIMESQPPAILVETIEEERFLREFYIMYKSKLSSSSLYTATPLSGTKKVENSFEEFFIPGQADSATEFFSIITGIRDSMLNSNGTRDSSNIYVLRSFDLSEETGSANARCIKNCMPIISNPMSKPNILIFVCHRVMLHSLISRDITVFRHGLLSEKGIEPLVKHFISKRKSQVDSDPDTVIHVGGKDKKRSEAWKVDYSDEDIENICGALSGLTEIEISHLLKYNYRSEGILDPQIIGMKKCDILKNTGLIEVYPPSQLPSLDNIGGWDNFKSWISKRGLAFHSSAARDFGCPPPKGVLFLGPPGTAKSHVAKAIGKYYGLPVVRIDMARIMDKFVGNSEKNMAMVTDILDALNRAIVWVRMLVKVSIDIENGITLCNSCHLKRHRSE